MKFALNPSVTLSTPGTIDTVGRRGGMPEGKEGRKEGGGEEGEWEEGGMKMIWDLLLWLLTACCINLEMHIHNSHS